MKIDSAFSPSSSKSFQKLPLFGDLCTNSPRSERQAQIAVDAALATSFSASDMRVGMERDMMEAMSAGGISSLDAFFRSIVLIFNTLSELEWSSMSLSRRYSMSSSASRVSMYSLVDSEKGCFVCGQNSHSKQTSSRVCGSA